MRSVVLPDEEYALEIEDRCETDFIDGGEDD